MTGQMGQVFSHPVYQYLICHTAGPSVHTATVISDLVSGIFVLKIIRSLEHSFPWWNFRSRDHSFPGKFIPQTIRSLKLSFSRKFAPWSVLSLELSFLGPFVIGPFVPDIESYVENSFLEYDRSNTSFIVYVKW